jgi:peptidylprolyl isomerase
MTQAKSGDTVKVHYTGTLDDGTEFDSSKGKDPLVFTLGSGEIIPGFNKAVEGMLLGEKKTIGITPEDAYGPRNEQMVQDVPRNMLPEDMEPAIGMPLQAQGPDGQTVNLTVTAVAEESIVVDGNHPLAGQTLNFAIELVAIN